MLRRRQAKRRQINADPRGTGLRRIGSRLRENPFRRGGDWLRGAIDVARWPLERLVWAFERRILWPLQELGAGLPAPSLPATGRTAGATALACVALAAAAIGAVSLTGGGSDEDAPPPVAVAPAAAPADAPPQQPDDPALEGVPPSFGTGGVAAGTGSGEGGEQGVGSGDAVTPGSSTAGDEESAAATSSSGKPVPAGPAAMKVARRFSEAFVLYEIGERPARAMAVFSETAAPRLATALAERPPRQPAGTEVPQARVLNLVPGPRRGKAYTVSASLLRVGVTSELRLQMKNQGGNWVVTDVRG